MIVYGDPSFPTTLGDLLARLQARLGALDVAGDSDGDDLRALLILSGELEQAVEDALPGTLPPADVPGLAAWARALCDHAADAFCAAGPVSPGADAAGRTAAALEPFARCLNAAAKTNREKTTAVPGLRVKVPEGFAFYGLYPEQYVVAARRWAADHALDAAGQTPVLVVGVRSIGTTLSAVVAAVLRAGGWPVRRTTVRPAGHPFERRATLPAEEAAGAHWGLIVDEGPGMSGSSFAAVADALVRAGLERSHIVFFPGHANEPGNAASEPVRAWWGEAPRCVASLDDLRWRHGRTLTETLAARTCVLLGESEQNVSASVRVDDLGGGLWRGFVYDDPACWPAACIPFESSKYRCTFPDGRAVLWKFAGLASSGNGAEQAFARLTARARAGWTTAPLAHALGWIATPWIAGTPLTPADGNAATLAHVGRYIAAVAGPPLVPKERAAAFARLREMTYWNVWEALGEEIAARTTTLANAAAAELGNDNNEALSSGDGRLAPHEWLRTPNGDLVKTDAAGHDGDHTVVGAQPLAWDIAGALIEWGLDAGTDGEAGLLAAAQNAGARLPAPQTLRFYRLAHAAFRLGQTTLCAHMLTHDPDEQTRLRRAAAGYHDAVSGLLSDTGV